MCRACAILRLVFVAQAHATALAASRTTTLDDTVLQKASGGGPLRAFHGRAAAPRTRPLRGHHRLHCRIPAVRAWVPFGGSSQFAWDGHEAQLQRKRRDFQPSWSRLTLASAIVTSPTEAGAAVDRIPVTVVTGFLGSGKTTLINNILTQAKRIRIAVIENDVSEISIDEDLVAAAQPAGGRENSVMVLKDGCLCCSVSMRGDLIGMISNLTSNYRDEYDHIIIETTGLAAIGPIIATFYMDDVIDKVTLDGIVTLVDAKHITFHLDEGAQRADGSTNEALDQIAYAERIVLNKIDLVNREKLSRVEQRLRHVNGMAEIIRTEKSQLDVDYVLGIGGFNIDKIEEDMGEVGEEDLSEDVEDQEYLESNVVHSEVVHSDAVSSVSIELEEALDFDKVKRSLEALLEAHQVDLYRMKGIFSIKGVTEKVVFQGVHQQFEVAPMKEWGDDEERTSKVVFIGRNLPKDEIVKVLSDCIAS